ncbi:MAG TPA: septal ring lytic transglycosylase RlpA family lipoprotein, partial [Casimicrobiaceae bacterium]|nr:septal ring lytic transglycosylase RlpA family lipoprotein [Casimicrobiaceae bacterium]
MPDRSADPFATRAARLAGAAIVAIAIASCTTSPTSPTPTSPTSTTPRSASPGAAVPSSRYYADDGPPDSTPADLDGVPDAVPRAEPLHRFANRPYV